MSSTKEFRKDIAGLRAVAVLLVIAFHLGTFVSFDPSLKSSYFLNILHENLKAGFLGVDIFFVISGFLMTSIIFNKVLQSDTKTFPAIWNFWKARAKRICPALLVAVVVFFLIAVQLFEPHRLASFAKEIRYALTFSSNFLYSRDEGYFAESSLEKVLLHTWSLAVEWQFYLIYPILLVLFKRFLGLNKTKNFVLAITIIAALYTLLAPMNTKSYYMLHVRAWELLLGGVVYLYPCTIKSQVLKKVLQIVGLIAVICSVFIAEEKPIWDFATPALAVIGSALVLWVHCKNILLDNPIFQYLGNISYSLYIYHWPVLVILSLTLLLNPIAALSIIIVLACLSYHFVEKTRAYGNKFLIFYLAVIALNVQVAKSHGWEWRIDESYYDQQEHKSLLVQVGFSPESVRVSNKIYELSKNKNNIWLLGDSHADHFYNLLNTSFHDSLELFIFHGTLKISDLFISGFLIKDKSLQEHLQNKDTIKNYHKLLASSSNLIIVLSQRWIDYKERFYQPQSKGYPCLLNDVPCEAIAKQVSFEEALYDNLDKLLQSFKNHQVFILGSLYPIREFNNPQEFAHIKHMPLSQLYNWYQRKYGTDQLLQRFKYQMVDLYEPEAIDKTLKKLASKYDNVHFYDVRKNLCEGNKCRALTDDGQFIFWDDDHLSKVGAELVGKDLVEQIKETLNK